jgi:hypothetical protein
MAPPTLYCPAGHDPAHVEVPQPPPVTEYLPASHGEQAVFPPGLHMPMRHLSQPRPRPRPYLPAGQMVQAP